MTISVIAAVGRNNELGKNGNLIWHFHEDMKFFRETTGSGTVIMGRKTFESLPGALKNRQNIVVTRNKDFKAEGAQTVHSLDEALKAADRDDIYIIGGAQVYAAALELADKIILTEIDDECETADVYFPKFDKSLYTRKIIESHTENGVFFEHVIYTKQS